MVNIFSELFSKILTDTVIQKTNTELLKGREKRIVRMPLIFRISVYIISPIIFCLFVLLFIIPIRLFVKIMLILFFAALSAVCIMYIFLAGTKIIYNTTEIEVITFYVRKRFYNVLDIKKARSSLYFFTVTFSDSFVILTDSMMAASEFYAFAVQHAELVKGKY